MKIRVEPGPGDDRQQQGTKRDRHDGPIRYGIAIAAALIAAIGATVAIADSSDASGSAHAAQQAAGQASSSAGQASAAAAQAQATANGAQATASNSSNLANQVAALAARLANDEQQTCTIQARGLPAGHELAASMADIHKLLTLRPTTPAERAAAKRTPPTVRAVLRDLDQHLARYQRDEHHQPQSRRC